jgi:hypothetical protein
MHLYFFAQNKGNPYLMLTQSEQSPACYANAEFPSAGSPKSQAILQQYNYKMITVSSLYVLCALYTIYSISLQKTFQCESFYF